MTPPCSNFTRRKFITDTSTTAVGLTLMSSSAVRGTTTNAKVRVGCIGLGGRGKWIAGLFRQHEGFEVAAVADYFPEVSQREGVRLGVPRNRCFSGLLGYQRVLDSGVEALVLETPPYCFPEHACAAVAAGCHVYSFFRGTNHANATRT